MKRSILSIALLSLLAASSVAMAGNGSCPGVDPTQAFEVSGRVEAFTGGSGSGMPMITVDDPSLGMIDVALGPAWFLRNAEFSAAPDDDVRLLAYPCLICATSAVAAWVENITAEAFIDLRDEDGCPLWTQRQQQRSGSGRPGQGNGSGGQNGGGSGGGPGGGPGGGSGKGSGLDMSQVATVTGVVTAFTGHAGSGQPILTLGVDMETYEITVSPYGPIAAAGLVIEPGMDLTVVFAPTECEEDPHLVTISIRDEVTGLLVQLRDPETGFPMAVGGGHNRPNWP